MLAVAVGVWNIDHSGLRLGNDSYQYISVAENLQSHRAIATSLVHFDVERAARLIPAPEVTFPGGYSVAIWTFASVFHCRMETAGAALSFVSLMLVLPLLWYGARLLKLGPGVTRMCLVLWAFSSPAQQFATTVASEALFTFLVFVAVLLLASDAVRLEGQHRWRLQTGYLLVGMSYWVRYAAVLLIAAFAVYAVARMLYERRFRPAFATAVALSLLPPAAYMVRNRLVSYAWSGDHSHLKLNSVVMFCRDTASSAYRLLIGDVMPRSAEVELVIIAAAIAGIACMWRASAARSDRLSVNVPSVLVFTTVVVVYCAGIMFLALFTKISYDVRMFLPVLPEFMLLSAVVLRLLLDGVAPARQRFAYTMALVALAAYCWVHIRALRQPVKAPEYRVLATAFALPTSTGVPLSSWVARNIAPDAPIAASDGQATGYLLHHKTLSLIGHEYSRTDWSETVLRQLMKTFGVKYLVLYPHAAPNVAPAEYESPFLSALLQGQDPGWLKLAAANPRVQVFKVQY